TRRLDTTAMGVYSLKPQTVNLIKSLKVPIKMVSLYSAEAKRAGESPEEKESRRERMRAVQDLLNEYQRSGRNIEIDFIDPQANPAKEDGLIQEVSKKYGGEVAKYKQFLDG